MLYTPRRQRVSNKQKRRKLTGDCSEACSASPVRAAGNPLYTSDLLPTELNPRKIKPVAAVKEIVSSEPEVKTSEHSDPDYQTLLEYFVTGKAYQR